MVTAPQSTSFFRGQLAYFGANGLDVEVVSAPGPQLDEAREQGATPRAIPMAREIRISHDIVSLWRLWRLFLRTRPDLVVAGTPKAGLLGTLAARLARVPHVIYRLQGLRLETARGSKRCLLWLTEWIACHAAHRVLSVSMSLKAAAVGLRIVAPEHCNVAGSGTSNGIDCEHWRRTSESAGRHVRTTYGVPPGAPLVGFVGRLVRDKGIVVLYEAFLRVRRSFPDTRLLLVGGFEEGDPVPAEVRARLAADPTVSITGVVADPAPYYWAMDMLAFPTYREGFPGVPLEAQAASVPVVCTNATGAVDAVLDGITGLQVPVGDVNQLALALERLLGDHPRRAEMGRAGCAWVEKTFRREAVWKSLLEEYRSALQINPLPTPRLPAQSDVSLANQNSQREAAWR